MPLPSQGSTQQTYHDHLVYDNVGFRPTALIFELEAENLQGHFSGTGPSSPWCTPVGPKPNPYNDLGTATATAATTLTDSAKTGANAWATNEWAGRIVVVAGGAGGAPTQGVIASNTATVLTLTAAGWSNGTPGNNAYQIMPGQYSKFVPIWEVEGPKNGNTDAI